VRYDSATFIKFSHFTVLIWSPTCQCFERYTIPCYIMKMVLLAGVCTGPRTITMK
jgi:hypothetical protein